MFPVPHHHCCYVSGPPFVFHHPINLTHATSRSGASDRNTCSRNSSFFSFCSFFFFLLILFPSPVPRSGLSEGQSRGKVPPIAITSALPQVSMLPGSCSPSRPCGRLCVPRCVIQQSLQGPCPVYCSHPLLCAWPRTQVNHLAQGPPRELCLQVHHCVRLYTKKLLWLSSGHAPGEEQPHPSSPLP